jgi:hypothetical protein
MHFLFVFLVQVRERIHFWFSSWIYDPFCFYVCGYLLDSFTERLPIGVLAGGMEASGRRWVALW